MPKIAIYIGFGTTSETQYNGKGTGNWVDTITERKYYADVNRESYSQQYTTSINQDIRLSNSISILSDKYILDNYEFLRYVKFRGSRYTVASIEEDYPRLNLTFGSLYAGPIPVTPTQSEEGGS